MIDPETSDFFATLAAETSKPQLVIEYKTQRNNESEMRLRVQISTQVNTYCVDLRSFICNLTEFMENTYMGNSIMFWVFYKLVPIDKGVEVWHQTVHSELDRLVCTIREID